MYPFFLTLLVTTPLFALFDLLWLGVFMKDFYQLRLGHLLAHDINWYAAIAFYFIFVSGLLYFAVHPAFIRGEIPHAFFLGALCGFFAYATYDLTNLATLSNWPVSVALVDMIWGSVLSGVVATIAYATLSHFS